MRYQATRTRRRPSAIPLLALLLALPGCASLRVDVDILEHPLPEITGREQIRSFTEDLLAEPVLDPEQRSVVFHDALEEAGRTVIEGNAEAYVESGIERVEAEKLATSDWDCPGQLRSQFQQSWATEVAPLADQVWHAALRMDAALAVASEAEVEAAFLDLRERYFYFLNAFNRYVQSIGDLIEEERRKLVATTTLRRSLSPDAQLRGVATAEQVTGRVVGHPIFDPLVSRVLKEESAWHRFGTMRMGAELGTSQFVVIQDGVVFRPKSLDFDPTPVIGAGTAMTRMGLEVAASLASGRFASLTATGGDQCQGDDCAQDGGGTLNDSSLVNEAQMLARRNTLRTRKLAQKDLLMALADLLDQAEALKIDAPATSAAAIKALRQRLQKIVGTYRGGTAAAPVPDSEKEAGS